MAAPKKQKSVELDLSKKMEVLNLIKKRLLQTVKTRRELR